MKNGFLVHGFELIVALVSVLSEQMLARGKSFGWLLATLACILTGIFFLLGEHYILAVVEMLNVPFTIYGFYKWKRGIEKVTKTDSIMSFVAIATVLVYFFSADGEILETISSGAFLIGGLLVARNKKLGWYINIVADTLLAYILFESSDYLFVCFQMLSIAIALRKTLKPISKKVVQNSEPLSLLSQIFKPGPWIAVSLHIFQEHTHWSYP